MKKEMKKNEVIMENQIEIVKDIAEGMIGIGGIPNNQEFYDEFNSRVTAKLGIKTECKKMKKEMKKEMKCYNVIFEKSKKKYLYLADEANSSDSGYIGEWLITPDGDKIKIVSIVFYPKTVIDGLPYILKKINLAELSIFEETSVVQKDKEADSVEMVKEIFRNMGISI